MSQSNHRKTKDPGMDFDSIYQKFYDPKERIKRRIIERRQQQYISKKIDVGL